MLTIYWTEISEDNETKKIRFLLRRRKSTHYFRFIVSLLMSSEIS